MTALADPRALLYRQLDPAQALALARETLSKCDDGELYMQFTASEAFGFDDGDVRVGTGKRKARGKTAATAARNNQIWP